MRIAIIGFGKIARDQHCPALSANPDFNLVAVVAPGGDPDIGLPWFSDTAQMFAAMADRLDAVAICTPPSVRYDIARQAIAAGVAVLLEKPPAATVGEIAELVRLAEAANVPLYAGWHSQHASGVEAARAALSGETLSSLSIVWRENVRKWHPSQQWIWRAGGCGVFDPAINGLSIASRILPVPLLVSKATLFLPDNRQTPIAADIEFQSEIMHARFDWRVGDVEEWSVSVETVSGKRVDLADGGHRLKIDGQPIDVEASAEYPRLYRRFAEVFRAGVVEVDSEPLRIVADAFLIGQRVLVDAFEDRCDDAAGATTTSGDAG